MNGESVRDNRLKVDTLTAIDSAATMLEVQRAKNEQALADHGKQLAEQGAILKRLDDAATASSEEREKRRLRDDAIEAKERRLAKRNRIKDIATLVGAATGLLAIVLTAILTMLGHAPATPLRAGEHETSTRKE